MGERCKQTHGALSARSTIWSSPTGFWRTTACSTNTDTSACAIPAIRSAFCWRATVPAAFVEPGDILEFTLDGNAVERRQPAALRGALPACRDLRGAAGGEVGAVRGLGGRPAVRHHADAASTRARHRRRHGHGVPVWDIADKFGDDTDLSVSDMERARDLAQPLGGYLVVLRRGVGFVATGRTLNDAVRSSVYIPKNARTLAHSLQFGPVQPDLARRDPGAARDRPATPAPRLGILGARAAARSGFRRAQRRAGCGGRGCDGIDALSARRPDRSQQRWDQNGTSPTTAVRSMRRRSG